MCFVFVMIRRPPLSPQVPSSAASAFSPLPTQVHDGGIGFWIKDNGLAEIVSCFTYYCSMGYVSSGGGKIRSLNGNNSYGTYGTISTGFDSDELPVNGYMYGDTLTYDPATLNTSEGFTVGDTITGPTQTGSRIANDISLSLITI